MAGTRTTFGRVDALVAVLALLSDWGGVLDGVQISDTWQGSSATNECIYSGPITGDISQGPMRRGGTIDDDEFVIPLHVEATKTSRQKKSLDARVRCEEMMTGIRQAVAANANPPGVPGLFHILNDGADGPDAEAITDPAGWIAYGTVRVRARIRMQ